MLAKKCLQGVACICNLHIAVENYAKRENLKRKLRLNTIRPKSELFYLAELHISGLESVLVCSYLFVMCKGDLINEKVFLFVLLPRKAA